jgi:hypothetical protein
MEENTRMAAPRTARRTALGAAAVAATGALIAAGIAVAPSSNAAAAATCGALFDDFDYASSTAADFTGNRWIARNQPGDPNGDGPGVPGTTWSPQNITFPTVDGEKVAQLALSTDGTAAGTTASELLQDGYRFMNGTYATRIKFTDNPSSGTDGDHVNETFFAIGPPQKFDWDPDYSELDFSEYLPNGGWGVTGNINYQTSWNGYKADPWDPHNAHSEQARSFDGWHDLVSQVADGHVRYYIDGALVGDHTVDDKTGSYPVYPRVPMSLRFNLWLIDTAGHTTGTSSYEQQMDWVYYTKNEIIAPADVTARAAAFRASGTKHSDSIDTNTCGEPTTPPSTPPVSPTASPTVSPTTPPTTTPPTTTPPTTVPPTSTPPVDCSHARAWRWGTVYLAGQRVKHKRHLWQANWWTLGSEPGLTAQWKDLGKC